MSVVYFSTGREGEQRYYCQVGSQIDRGGLGELISKEIRAGFAPESMRHARVPVSPVGHAPNIANSDMSVMLLGKDGYEGSRVIMEDRGPADGECSKVGYCAIRCLKVDFAEYSKLISSDKDVSKNAQLTYEGLSV